MKRQIGVAMLVALTALTSLASGALAQCTTGMLIKWDENGFAYETLYNPNTFISSATSQLVVVGKVSAFCQMLIGLDATDPTKEYTYIFSGLTSAGTVGPTAIAGGSTRWTTNYGNGQFFIYEDNSPDAPNPVAMPASPPNATVPANYTDGTVILSGNIVNFSTTITRFSTGSYATSFRGDFAFTGGTLFNLVGPEFGLLTGLWCANDDAAPGVLGLCDLPTGYSSHPNGKFDQPSTPAQTSTWGAIKQLYR